VILFELTQSEHHPVYQALQISNVNRQYDFLRSIVAASLGIGRPCLSTNIIKALNFQAITCLHINAGEFRPCQVYVGQGETQYQPPEHYRVQALMDDLVNEVNRNWETVDPVILAAYVLWRLNWIHPFINGNGRTARAVCYFILCIKAGTWLPGTTILPELIRRDRAEYVVALKQVDASFNAGKLDLAPLHAYLQRLLLEQFQSAQQQPADKQAQASQGTNLEMLVAEVGAAANAAAENAGSPSNAEAGGAIVPAGAVRSDRTPGGTKTAWPPPHLDKGNGAAK
jgi:hypothetical protein